jgi:hypothetical protein
MNSCLKYFSASLLALLTQAAFAQVPDLGAASDFTLLSAPTGVEAGAVTCTDSTIIGNVGSTDPADSVAVTCIISEGSFIAPVSAGVVNDFYAAYDAVAAIACDETLTGTLDGRNLTPGVYCFDAAATLTGTLTLVGPSTGNWIFKVGTGAAGGALTATDFNVAMAGDACNVTWWSEAAATITRGEFKGTILTGAAFTATGTATTGSTFDGQALAGRTSVTAGVTVTDMTVTGCEAGSRGGKSQSKCNQGVGNGPEDCDPGNSNQDDFGSNPFTGSSRSNDELGGTPGDPGRKGGNN